MDNPNRGSSRFQFAGFEVEARARKVREPRFRELHRKVGLER